MIQIRSMRWLGVALAVGASASLAHAGAGDGAVQWTGPKGNGHWYELISKPASFEAAQAAAIARGGHLAVLTSAAENAFVFSSVVSPGGLSNGSSAWIGAQSIAGKCDDDSGYLWVTGESFDFENWAPGYPADLGRGDCAAGFTPTVAAGWANFGRSEQINYVIEWSADCNKDGIVDYGQIRSGELSDTNNNGIPDCCEAPGGCGCEAGDCNKNGICDDVELKARGSDCDGNGILDECDVAAGAADCNDNGIPDSCDIASGIEADCNKNGIPDSCDLARGAALDCNKNGIPDSCDIAAGTSADVNGNGIPDGCEGDCDGDGIPDAWAVSNGLVADCNANGIPDACDIASGKSTDCDGDGVIDSCAIAAGDAADCDANGIPDACDIVSGAADCNANGIPDSCEIASGAAADCNANGIPDACDLAGGKSDCNMNGIPDACDIASGDESDMNGNGVPDSCEPEGQISLVGPGDGAPATCLSIGDVVTFDVMVSNPPLVVVAGQFGVTWDPSMLEYVGIDGGDAPISSIPFVMPNQTLGYVFWISSVQPGGTGSGAGGRVASLRFRLLADDCAPTAPQARFDPTFAPILLAAGNGGSASLPTQNPAPFTVDSAAPEFTNVPADRTVYADAGLGCRAVRSIGQATATDACGTATVTSARSDGQALGAPWPCGTTVVTWTATDACGRTALATTSVTVDPFHEVSYTVAYDGVGYAPSMTRCITFNVGGVDLSQVLTFTDGVASGTGLVPVGNYSCATADDRLHSLVSQSDVFIKGRRYQVNFAGSTALVNGDLNDDNLVNVVDWAILVVRIGQSAPVDTDCGTPPFHCDFDGDGSVTMSDGDRLLAAMLRTGADPCSAGSSGAGGLLGVGDRIDLPALRSILGPDAAKADFNRDGVVDGKDVEVWKRGGQSFGSRRR